MPDSRTTGEPTWDQVQQAYRCPPWFADAKLGIWVHWGPQSQPLRGGGWYARHMYMADTQGQDWGNAAYAYHQQTYGHQSQAGFKDVINAWRAEKLDPDAILDYAQWLGARYFVVMANHHDHFDNFDSSHHPWNSVRVGPKRDIVGDFAAASRRRGIPFGVSSHDDRMLMYYEHAFDSDADGPMKGVPYDGNLTTDDGDGTWWEGLDPADLYGPPPSRRTDEWVAGMKATWELRHKELVSRYQPDLLWFDGYGFPYGEHGKEVSRFFYAQSLAKTGRTDNVLVAKIPEDPAVIDDIERGVAEQIRDVWQATLSPTGWFYCEDESSRHDGRTMIEILADVISKNGNLLLNIELFGDGSIPPQHQVWMDDLGRWTNLNAEAIFGSRPWRVFGDNISGAKADRTVDMAEDAAHDTDAEHFNERTVEDPPYAHDEVRFTTNNGHLYVFVLNPTEGLLRLPALGAGAATAPGPLDSVVALGIHAPLTFSQDENAAVVAIPADRPLPHTLVLRIDGPRLVDSHQPMSEGAPDPATSR